MRRLGTIICLIGFSLPAFTQIRNIAFPANPSGSHALQQHLQQKPLSRQLLKNMANKPLLIEPVLQNYDHTRLRRKSVANLPVTYFKPGVGTILPRQLAEIEGNAQERAKAVQYYEGLIDLYQEVARKDGFPPNNVAYAFNYYVVNNYQIMHDLLSTKMRVSSITPIGGGPRSGKTVSLDQERTLFCQFEEMLSEDPSIVKMNDTEKQSITESLAIMTNECFKLYQYALENDDKAILRQAQDNAYNNLVQLLGERAVNMRITDRGMEF
ncbi:DUF6683 family protein [Flavilitoribacter nigricans]|nr:DUF6683 family protein [Flavilitoribacter nigricans]